MQRPAIIAVAALALIVAIAAYLFYGRTVPEPEPVAPPAAPVMLPPVEPIEEPLPPLPALAESDAYVRQLATEMGLPEPLAAAIDADVIRTLVRVVDTVASGQAPKALLPFLAPDGDFVVVEQGSAIVADDRSYARYDGLAATVSGIDARAAATTYDRIEPLANESFAEVGGPPAAFRSRLLTALDVLLATPTLEGRPRLIDVAVDRFEYAEPHLEGLKPVQKQLLRMGPNNQMTIQRKLAELREILTGGA